MRPAVLLLQIDSYGGLLKYKVRYTLARGRMDPVQKPDVIIVGNGRRLIYQRGNPTPPRELNSKEVKFLEVKQTKPVSFCTAEV